MHLHGLDGRATMAAVAEAVQTKDQAAGVPAELCGYVVDCALKEGQSYLAIGPGGRGVVLKKLDADCLLRGVLHPSIRERLCRVRELAHGGVANLHGVGREGENAYLIWEYIPGRTFDQYAGTDARHPRDLLVLARELILTVDSLHMQGIVHGAINGGNVIVADDGSVRLTHVSPLLYTDAGADIESVVALLDGAAARRGERESPFGRLLSEAASSHMSLRQLGVRIAALLESRDAATELPPGPHDRHRRRRMLAAAALVSLLGMALGYGVWRAVEQGRPNNSAFPWTSPPVPAP